MKCKLSDICNFRKGKIGVSNLTLKTYISTENMLPNKGGITEASSLPTAQLTQEYKKGDVLVSNIRPYFKKIWLARHDGGCSNDVLVFQGNSNIDGDFFYYVLANDDFFAYSMATSKGTKMPRGDKTSIMQYEVPIFDIDTQRKIASVLRSLDEKIELNSAINNNLEQQMQAIFNAFFLTFDLHTYSTYMETEYGRIPSNWQFMELGNANLDISDGNYSSKYPKQNEFLSSGIPFIRGTDFNGTSISQSDMLYISPEKHSELKKGHTKRGDILITTRGEIGRIAFVPDSLVDVNINSQLVRINGSNIVPRSYLACYLTSTKVQNDFKTLTYFL